LKADFVTTEKLTEITEGISTKAFIEEIRYDNDLVELMNDNVKKITFWVLIISGLFTLIAVLLINSSIRLAVYSKRFIIKTMQMVGATKTFIRRPFVWKSVQLGIIGALVALAGMAVVLYYLDITFPELELLRNTVLLVSLFVGIFVLGIVITWISTFIATQRFLDLKTDQLYY
jgi:cell division transport system permease protein